jgi:1-acyl-sn-glycerol-3-phosphate acyltransferase
MKKIYEDSVGYEILRYIADPYIHGAFKKIRYEGMENLPKEGAIILSPNHCDALMDPLTVLAMNHEKKVFVARADLFQKPVLRKILTYFKIMPIHRVRDGFRNVLQSENTIEKSIEVLNNLVPFCILPEGRHRPMHSLLPLGKGISRVAIGADKALKGQQHVYIVPVGCEYGDYFRYRASTLLITIGKPIDVSAYVAEHADRNEAMLLNDIRSLTAAAMKKLIVYIPDDDDYEATWEGAKLVSGQVPESDLRGRFAANRNAAERIGKLREEQPDKARKLFEKVLDFTRERKRARVSLHATYAKHPLATALWRTLKTLVCLPFVLAMAIASSPALGVGEKLAHGVKDQAFRNSFRCGVLIVLWTILLVVWAIVLFCTVKWYWALAALALLVPAPMLVYEWVEQLRRCASSWRYLCNGRIRSMKKELMNSLNTI